MDSFPVGYLLQSFFTFLSVNPQANIVLGVLLLTLIILTFVVSGSEVALFSLSRKEVNLLKTKPHPAAKRITGLLEEPKEVYASLLIAGTFINISIIVLANYFIDQFLSPSAAAPAWLVLVSKALFIAFILVFFGRLLPKVYATQDNLRFAYDWSFLIEGLHLLMHGLSRWTVSLADGIGAKLGANKTNAMSIKELDEAIDIKTDEEASPAEKSIMKGVVKFGNITVKQIVRSRLDVSGIEESATFGTLIKKVAKLHYSRLPVYKDTMDEIVGIINTKDLIPYLNEADSFNWLPLMRQPYFVPEAKLIEDLLKEFQQKRIHFAIVVDEFGGTSGIVTMEDILEEVIGDIRDEFDDEENDSRKVDDNNYIFEGRTMLHDMCKLMKLPTGTFDKIRGESESLAGLLLEVAGEFPEKNAVLNVGQFDFTILETDINRIKQVKVTIKEKPSK